MSLQRHIVSGSSSSFALVQIGKTGQGNDVGSNVRAVFQSPGDGRRKAAFGCCQNELDEFLRVIGEGAVGESALVTMSRSGGILEVVIVDSGERKIRYEIHASRTRTGAKGIVCGKYRQEPIRTRGEKGTTP